MDETPLFRKLPLAALRLNPELKVVGQSEQAVEEFGDGAGHLCHQALFKKEERCRGCNVARVLRDRRPERWFLRDGGRDFEIAMSPVLNDEGEVVELIEVVRDATVSFAVERHLIDTSEQLEEEMQHRSRELALLTRQTDELTGTLRDLRRDQAAMVQMEKMASLGRLAAGLTHEMHTPLGALVSNVDMLRRCVEALEGTPKKEIADELLDLQQLAADRMKKILDSLRRFAHLDKAEVEAYDVHEGIDAAIALLAHQTKGRIDVQRNYAELPTILCRPDAINQVFMNLLENAVTAIEGPGAIVISTAALGSDAIELTIQDDGPGVPPDLRDKIFDPGFTTKPRGVGTGLGLAIVQSTLAAHGGSIELTSEIGEGSCFRIVLPLAGES